MNIPSDLKDINYPLFTTTDEEKEVLRAVLRSFKEDEHHSPFLCINIEEVCKTDYEYTRDLETSLISKIENSLGNDFVTLNTYLDCVVYCSGGYFDNFHYDENTLLRIYWVEKLLEYKE